MDQLSDGRIDADRLRCLIDRDVVAIDRMIADQLDAILHHPRLQRFEGSWRGLDWLVSGIEPPSRIHVRLLSAAWPELCRDLDRAPEFDQSILFRRIYEDEFGRPGGEPFGLMVIDHELTHRRSRQTANAPRPTDDVAALASLAAVAAAAFAPIVVAASPSLLDVDRFDELALSLDPSAPLRDSDHARWRGLAAGSDLRFLCLTLPRVLARPVWTLDPARDGCSYAEYAPKPQDRVWSVSGYAFASTVIRAQAQFGWPADIRGVDADRLGGGLVPDLVREAYTTDRNGSWCRPSLELTLTERQDRQLVDAGIIPINHLPHGNEAAFSAVRSMHGPASSETNAGDATPLTANARLSAQINSVLCVSRFAHYLKVMGREMVGAFLTAEEIERRLQKWLSNYTNGNSRGDAESRARHPLVSSKIRVVADPSKPGTFGCVMHLQPHYQLDDIDTTFQLATEFVVHSARSLN
ncbi:type VI secretion system contractile sheath large subunit [Acidisoma cellulosilytica]|uniref:Type VI secretion system contractile sheath large subunit n=1 Tax=Acidisoma cellulosilyticum TaxID=2802395 RepID=A0A964E4J6_9PROT|nr:type VI secretion system contractile sheath large subunit [Acidisoma cellulosilyticum]MCB8881043.1 type VI secretion system contractile sheath large subunit [Acidisoma cellulosilyticum]